ncbi:unnamed protein product [marine sediment metagenome]|uniref:Uncharacterized protein n=1 Tax=marine sediment metagenome TaxID=412755 RepID=X1R7K8_9ZZZZ
MKSVFIVDPECGETCDLAEKRIKTQLDAGEIEKMETAEAMRKGVPLKNIKGSPAIIHYSEKTNEVLGVTYFHRQGGDVELSPSPSLIEMEGTNEGWEPKAEAAPQELEKHGETAEE